eukprot:8099239-Pyramimonas_sp.AAC.3
MGTFRKSPSSSSCPLTPVCLYSHPYPPRVLFVPPSIRLPSSSGSSLRRPSHCAEPPSPHAPRPALASACSGRAFPTSPYCASSGLKRGAREGTSCWTRIDVQRTRSKSHRGAISETAGSRTLARACCSTGMLVALALCPGMTT